VSNLKDTLKNKIKRDPVHTQLIDTTNGLADMGVQILKTKKKFEETHTRQTYYIENDLIDAINKIAGSQKGAKTQIINEAIRRYLK